MRIFVDSANPADIEEWDAHPFVSGFTTNPSLFKAAGASNYLAHAKSLVNLTKKSISVDGPEAVWDLGEHVVRKIVSTDGLEWDHRPINHTALLDEAQISELGFYGAADILSVFAGRIMDTGRSPVFAINKARKTYGQVLWASCREAYNIVQAEAMGCNIVTVPPAILRKYVDWLGKPLEAVAKETVDQFHRDAAGCW